MRDKVKRFISILMTALMLVNLLPVGALADGITSGGYKPETVANYNGIVYVYVKVTGNTDGLVLNKDGWYTIGTVSIKNMPNPSNYGYSSYGEHVDYVWSTEWFSNKIYASSVSGINHERNKTIPLEKVKWTGTVGDQSFGFIRVDSGATDYPNASKYTWHLDGYVNVEDVQAEYTVRYVDQDTGIVLQTAAIGKGKLGSTISHKAPKTVAYNGNDYTRQGEQDRTFKLVSPTNTFDIDYRRPYGYTVEYYYDGVKDDKKTETGSAWCKDVIEEYIDKTPGVGYEHEKTENLPLTIGTDESKNVIKVYYKKTGHTVTYAPGEHGAFEAKAYNAKYGDATPAFDGETTGKPGWTFDGWEPEVADTVTENATYIAKFVPDENKKAAVLYTISIGQSDYGSIAPSAQQIIFQATGKLDIEGGGSVSGSTATAKPGYKFAGWYKATGEDTYEWVTDDPELTSELAESKLNKDKETDLYRTTVFEARFEPDAGAKVRVTYEAENGTLEGTTSQEAQIVTGDGLTDVTAATPNKGYKFDGWYVVDKNGDKYLISGLDPAEELDAKTAKKNLNKDGNLYAATTFIARFVPDENQTVPVIYTTDENGILWGGPVIGSITYNVNIATGKVWLNNAFVDKLEPVPTYPKEGYEFDRWIRVSPETTIEGAGSTLTDEKARPNLNQKDGLYQKTEFKAIFRPQTNLSYTVNYYWNGTTEKVAESKTISGKMFGEEVTESPIGVKGYTPESTESQTITLGTGTNEINFYYYKNVELTANSGTLTYDGYEHGVSDFTGAPNVADFSDIKVEATGKNVGTYPAAFAEGTVGTVDKTKKYIVTKTTDGQLAIEKRKVTLTSEGGSKVYDGAPLTKPEVQIEGSFVDGEVLGIVAQGTVTDVSEGEVTNTIFFNRGTNFKESNYDIQKNEGKLSITKRSVTLTSETASKPYDGTELTRPVVKIEGSFVDGEVSDVKATGSVTNVSEGEVTNTITFKKSEKFKESNYNIIKTEGKLSITQAETEVVVKIAGDTAIVPYDGKKHTVERWTVTSITETEPQYDASNIGFEGTAIAEGTDAGTYVMGLKDTQFKNTNGNFKNVTFVVEDGQLEIKKREVTLTSETASKPYDGTALTKPVVAVTGDGFVEGEVSDVKATGSVTNVSEGEVLNPISVTPGEKFKAKNYSITKNEGKLSITPITDKVTVTITENSDTVTYDGDEHKVEGYKSITADNTLYDVATSVKATQTEAWTAKGTAAGEYPVGIVAGDFENTNKNFTNVEFVVVDGTLKITPVTDKVTVTITGRTLETTYDGKVHDVFGYDATPSNALYRPNEDIQFNGTDYDKIAKGTDAGKYDMKLTVEHFTNISDNFTNVEFIVTDGYVKINPRSVKLTSASDEKVYDGKPLTNETVAVGGDGFADGEGATYDFTGSQTDVGESDNLFTFEVNENTKKENYTFEVAIGTLKVNPVTDKVTVTVTEKSDTVTYDGMPHTVSGYASMTADNPLYDVENDVQETPNAAWAANGTDAGEYPLGIVAGDFKNTNENFTNVEFVVVDGALKIDPAPVTLQAPIASKTYDGTPLKAEDYGHSFVEGVDFADDFASISVEGRQTQAGSSVSQIKEVVPKKGKDLKNYKLTFLPGSLTVTKRSVLLTSQSATKTYDGSALTRPAVTITGDGFVPGELAKVEATGSITNVGSTPNAIQYTTTGAFNPANYSIALSVGTLTVTAKPEPEPRRTFNLTVNYVYQNGKRAAASYNRGGLKNGETFDITSPVIAGYTASETVVSGTIDNRDIKVTVIYTADGVNLDDYGVPLGLGNITMNVGDCFE